MTFRVWGYSQGEYSYIFSDRGLTLKYKDYSFVKEDKLGS